MCQMFSWRLKGLIQEMKAFKEFRREDKAFWFFIRFISERLGYTNRKTSSINVYTFEQIDALCNKENIDVSVERINKAVLYCRMRADVINNIIRNNLMTAEEASEVFEELYNAGEYSSKLIMNKQSGEKKKVNYFTAIVTMIAEGVLSDGKDLDFDPDPRGLIYLLNNRKIIGGSSRRFDGAYPSIYSPRIVWEIKEYYYTSTFGSRIADSVYETQLDGYEFNEIYDRTGQKVHHVIFVDSYKVWWEMGKSYTCRLIDALNMGLVDDVIFGREVLTEWEPILKEFKDIGAESSSQYSFTNASQDWGMVAEPQAQYGENKDK